MIWSVDPAAAEPLFVQIAACVRAALATGTLTPGDRLPAARELAATLDLNLHTVLRAYQDLRDEGAIELRRGRGAVVRAGGDYTGLRAPLDELVATARRLGVPPATTLALVRDALARPTDRPDTTSTEER